MNQLCKVCGEPAAGFHFGAFTCEGCKSFFGRTYNNLSSISECKNNGECVINKKNRTACKACRLRKCILVGMSKSGSRYGRRSNWFKIHCLLQEQQQNHHHHHQAGSNVAVPGLLRPHPYLTPLFRPVPTTTQTETRSSESDSGASSVDVEDDTKSLKSLCRVSLKPSMSPSSDRDYFSGSSSKKHSSPASDSEYFARKKNVNVNVNVNNLVPIPSVSPASLPSVSPGGINGVNGVNGVMVPKWFPVPPFNDPSTWRDLWLRIPPPIAAAAPAPNQDQPIDLSLKSQPENPTTPNAIVRVGNEQSKVVDDDKNEPVKSVPLDLSLERQAANVSNC